MQKLAILSYQNSKAPSIKNSLLMPQSSLFTVIYLIHNRNAHYLASNARVYTSRAFCCWKVSQTLKRGRFCIPFFKPLRVCCGHFATARFPFPAGTEHWS